MKTALFFSFLFIFSASAFAQDVGWIGVRIEDQSDRGAIVRGVEPNSPASKAGLREGDVIIEYDKQAVIGVQQLTRLVRETPVGRSIEIKVRRENREQTFQITTERGNDAGRLGRFELQVPGVRIFADRLQRQSPLLQLYTTNVQSGVRVDQLTDQLRDFFGVFSDAGVLVSSVDRGTAAEKAGLKAGDVITAVDGK